MIQKKARSNRVDAKKIWVSANIAIFTQLGMWRTTLKKVVFIPATEFGIIIVTDANSNIGDNFTRGWYIERPRGVELEWLSERPVTITVIPRDVAVTWYDGARGKRKSVWRMTGSVYDNAHHTR